MHSHSLRWPTALPLACDTNRSSTCLPHASDSAAPDVDVDAAAVAVAAAAAEDDEEEKDTAARSFAI